MSRKYLVPLTVDIHKGNVDILSIRPTLKPYFGVGIPQKHGGDGVNSFMVAKLHEHLAYGSASVAAHFVGLGLFSNAIGTYGTPRQKERYLVPMVDGKLIGCFALTGSDGGSNPAASTSLTFSESGEKYMLNGTRTFITNGAISDYAVVFAKDKNDLGSGKMTAFIVPSETKGHGMGFKPGKPWDLIGWRGAKTSDLYFDNVVVSEANMLGKRGEGLRIALSTISGMRANISAQALGLMQRAWDETVQFLSNRIVGNKKLIELPEIRRRLGMLEKVFAETNERVGAAVLLALTKEMEMDNISFELAAPPSLFKAQEGAGKEPDQVKLNIWSKVFSTDALAWFTGKALELHGLAGLTTDAPISVIWADSVVYSTIAGPNGVLASKLKG